MTELQTAMAMLIQVFNKYAAGEASSQTLTRSETKRLLETEMPDLLKATKNPQEVDRLVKGLDFDGDSEIDFTEFVTLVAALTCAAHDMLCRK